MSHVTHMHNPVMVQGIEQFQQAAAEIDRAGRQLADLGEIEDPGAGDWDHVAVSLANARQGMLDGVGSVSEIAHQGEPAIEQAIGGVAGVISAERGLERMYADGVPTAKWHEQLAPVLGDARQGAADGIEFLRGQIRPTPRFS